ncbi:MAG: polyphosphate kinase [Marinilabiliales bacterium]|nr:MAG: polyphosphate kinase [Marinilabiliales bacterium]
MLEKFDTRAPKSASKEEVKKKFNQYIERLRAMQCLLYAEDKRSVLIILQGMDASGKDSTVKHVFGQINPMGVRVKPFKKPTEVEYSYDFLRRIHKHTPPSGQIHIFNRSHYEDILVPEVHGYVSKEKIERRYDYINAFERNLVDHNTIIFKYFLHISKEEQVERFQRRLTRPDKYWKYDPSDLTESQRWDDYQKVYEKIFKKCSPDIPWTIIPADNKWYRNYLISKDIVEKLESLDMEYPEGYFSKEENRRQAEDALVERMSVLNLKK